MAAPHPAVVLVSRGRLVHVSESRSGRIGRSASDIVVNLLDAITTGEYPVGSRLPPLRSEQWRAAQQTVFHAMQQLVELGVVEARAKSGYYVVSVPRVSEVRADTEERLAACESAIEELRAAVEDLRRGVE
jgi:DNA-binding FadR family transcriptional regulator